MMKGVLEGLEGKNQLWFSGSLGKKCFDLGRFKYQQCWNLVSLEV